MFAWLNGPGQAFREPLPSSTNYLGAYNKEGGLRRLGGEGEGEEGEGEGNDAESSLAEKAAERQRLEEEDRKAGLSEEEIQKRRALREAEAEKEEADQEKEDRLPPEGAADLTPYPLNKNFRSQPVLSEELREKIYSLIVEDGQDVSTVSAVFGVDMRRVGAVVRLKTIEKDWLKQGKKLNTPYASAVMGMLPKTPYNPKSNRITPHEPINDLPVLPSTKQQIFYPTSESRHFTRADAAKVFSPTLLPADERIAHPELIQLEKDIAAGVSPEERQQRIRDRDEQLKLEKEKQEQKRLAEEARSRKVVNGARWDFKFQDINVENAGKDGRGKAAAGWRYGAPHQDRKRGLVKIPTSVES